MVTCLFHQLLNLSPPVVLSEFGFIVSLVDLLALLNWKAHPDRVLDILGRLRQINGEEIVKVSTGLYLAFVFQVRLEVILD